MPDGKDEKHGIDITGDRERSADAADNDKRPTQGVMGDEGYAYFHDNWRYGNKPGNTLTKRESRMFIWGALKAGLLIWAVVMGTIALFVLFCVLVWLK